MLGLFIIPPHFGHVNASLKLARELVCSGDDILYICTDEFKEAVLTTGSIPLAIPELSPQGPPPPGEKDFFATAFGTLCFTEQVVDSILANLKHYKIDYIVYDSICNYGHIISLILDIPSVSTLAIIPLPDEITPQDKNMIDYESVRRDIRYPMYKSKLSELSARWHIALPQVNGLGFYYGRLNLVYTSRHFVKHPDAYNDTFKFIGVPTDSVDNTEMLTAQKSNSKILYISLGTTFNVSNTNLYTLFFDALGDLDITVYMSAFKINATQLIGPKNFIIREYFPQKEILRKATLAITNCGLNSTSEMILSGVPFISVPLSVDQPYLAKRYKEFGVTEILNKNEISSDKIRTLVRKMITDSKYYKNVKALAHLLKRSDGISNGVEEIHNYVLAIHNGSGQV